MSINGDKTVADGIVPRLQPVDLLLAALLVTAVLSKYLYFLPIVGLVKDSMGFVSPVLAIVVVIVFASRVAVTDKVPVANSTVVAYLLFVYIVIYGFGLLVAVNYLLLYVICSVKKKIIWRAFDLFRTVLSVVLAVNVLAYPLVSLGLISSLGTISPLHLMKEEAGIYYDDYGITYVLVGLDNAINVGSLLFYRMSAWFEEPGNVGTFSVLVLAASGFRYDRRNYVILAGGALSFSLAFYLLLAVGMLAQSLKKSLVVLGIGVVALTLFSDNELVQVSILDRLDLTDSSIQTTRRTSLAFDAQYEKYIKTESVWFGHDPDQRLFNQPDLDMSSWKGLIWDFGIFGTILYLGFFLALALNTLRNKQHFREFLPFFLVFFMSVYQRPYVLDGLFVLIFYAALLRPFFAGREVVLKT